MRRQDLERYRDHLVDDLVGDDGHQVRLLLVGINPGLWTAAVNAHFARPGNRFWPALHRAGIVERSFDVSRGMDPEDAAELTARGIAISNLVARATARADELTAEELRAGVARLRRLVARLRPRVVGVLGTTAYRQAFAQPRAGLGRQPEDLEGAQLWVAPNPSGLNAHETVESLAAKYRELAEAAGVVPFGPRPPADPRPPGDLA